MGEGPPPTQVEFSCTPHKALLTQTGDNTPIFGPQTSPNPQCLFAPCSDSYCCLREKRPGLPTCFAEGS